MRRKEGLMIEREEKRRGEKKHRGKGWVGINPEIGNT